MQPCSPMSGREFQIISIRGLRPRNPTRPDPLIITSAKWAAHNLRWQGCSHEFRVRVCMCIYVISNQGSFQ